MHECIVGMRNDYENTDVVTLEELKDRIQRDKECRNTYIDWQTYELSDYCDKRKNTDLTRFEYCPMCGKKIDWKAIKKGGGADA